MIQTFIHLGQHKTGTTSIQESIKINSSSLLEKGIFVPTHFCGRETTNHYELNMIALNSDRGSPMKDLFLGDPAMLEREINLSIECNYQKASSLGLNSIIWSNEGLSLLRYHEEFQRLANLFRPYSSKLTAILCIRDRDEFKASWEKQLKSSGLYEANPSPESYKYTGPDSWIFDWGQRLPHLINTFEEVRIYRYKSISSVQDFYDIIGVGDSESIYIDELFLNPSK